MGLVTAYILYYEAYSNVCVAKIIARIIFIPSSVPSFSFYRYIIFCFCTLCLSLPCSGYTRDHQQLCSFTSCSSSLILLPHHIRRPSADFIAASAVGFAYASISVHFTFIVGRLVLNADMINLVIVYATEWSTLYWSDVWVNWSIVTTIRDWFT